MLFSSFPPPLSVFVVSHGYQHIIAISGEAPGRMEHGPGASSAYLEMT